MLKLIWSAIVGGGPAAWGGIALGVFLALGGAFAGGAFYEANHIATTGTVKAVAAQHEHDVKAHTVAVTAGKAADQRHAKGDAATKPIIQYIHDLPRITIVDDTKCDLTPEALKALNDAGHQ
jgi:hypothetical protein